MIMFSVLHHLVQRSKGRDPRFRPVDKDRDHPVSLPLSASDVSFVNRKKPLT